MINSKIQLFFLPYSGGKAVTYDCFKSALAPYIDIHEIEYAGRGTRAKEPFFEQYGRFIQDLEMQINSKRIHDLPFALFGYSIGSLFAYDLATKGLIGNNLKHDFVGGCCSADEHKYERKLTDLSDDEFWEEIIAMGGVRKELLNNKKFLKIFSKPLQADFRIGEQYVYNASDIKPLCNATILFSEDDTPFVSVKGWEYLFDGKVEFERFNGDHFFAFENIERTAQIINSRLKQYVNG